jgi:hypothetical protein
LGEEAKKQATTTLDKNAKAKLIEIAKKLKDVSQVFPSRFEYLITEIEESVIFP